MRDVNRLRILQDVIDRNLRPGLAAEMLGITPRHCSRLLKRYRQSGPLEYNLLYREEEREMLPLCEDQGVGVIPWSPMARGRLTRDWSVTSRRTQNDAFALKMYENAALLDKPVIDVVASIAEKHSVPRAHVAIAWLLSKSVITAPIIGATKPEHLSTAISALDFSLSDAEITELEVRYLPHPVDGIIPPLPGRLGVGTPPEGS